MAGPARLLSVPVGQKHGLCKKRSPLYSLSGIGMAMSRGRRRGRLGKGFTCLDWLTGCDILLLVFTDIATLTETATDARSAVAETAVVNQEAGPYNRIYPAQLS